MAKTIAEVIRNDRLHKKLEKDILKLFQTFEEDTFSQITELTWKGMCALSHPQGAKVSVSIKYEESNMSDF